MAAKVLEAEEAVKLIKTGDTITVSGSTGALLPEKVLAALEARFLTDGEPRDLTHFDPSPTGAIPEVEHFAHAGMLKRYIGSWFTRFPELCALIRSNGIEAYSLPLGSLHFLTREIARRNPHYLTQVGLNTSFDPRRRGGRLNEITKEDLMKVVNIDGREWMAYQSFPIDVALVRGTSADEDGNISYEEELMSGGALFQAMAARNSGGTVIAQVKRMVARGGINPRAVLVPGILVDAIVIDEKQAQTETFPDRYIVGLDCHVRAPVPPIVVQPLDAEKVVARRAAMELTPGDVINAGGGIPIYTMMPVSREEGVQDLITPTIEHGSWGGINFGNATQLNAAYIAPYDVTFNLYLGGGLDACYLGFAQIDKAGNVNVDKVGSMLSGVGGALDIAFNTKKVVFCGNFTARGPDCMPAEGKLQIVSEGKAKKFVDEVEWLSISGRQMWNKGQKVCYVTERAVFQLGPNGLVLTEIAPGVDLERDVLGQMEFRPAIAPGLKLMDERLFREEEMGLRRDLTGRDDPGPPIKRIHGAKTSREDPRPAFMLR